MNEQQARENQIEIRVEKMVDRLDRKYMADNSTMTETEYKEQMHAISVWADAEIALLSNAIELGN